MSGGMAMNQQATVMSDIINDLRKVNTHADLWLNAIKYENADWEEFLNCPINRENILTLARAIVIDIQGDIDIECLDTEELYQKLHQDGHAMLAELHRLGSENGIFVEIHEIDQPLSICEKLEQDGIIERTAGGIQLSQIGIEFAEAINNPAPPCKVRIKIVKTPKGGAPKWVRNKWIGIELETDTHHLPTRDFVTGQASGQVGGYEILADKAIEALEQISPDAATWFREFFPIGSVKHFVFDADCAEEIT